MNKKNGYPVGLCSRVIAILLLSHLPMSIDAFGRAARSPMTKGMSGVGRAARGADFSGMGFDNNRAPRPDALSYPGSTPQVVSPFNGAGLEEIKECICELKQLILNDSCCSQLLAIDEEILSTLDGIDTKIDIIINALGALSNIDVFISDLDILVSTIDQLNIVALTSLIDAIEGISSLFDPLASKIDLSIAIDETILSKVMVIDTRTSSIYSTDQTILSYVSDIDNKVILLQSAVSNAQNCCSNINSIDSRIGLIYSLDQTTAANVNTIQSTVHVIDTRTSNIYNTDQTILSVVELIAAGGEACSCIDVVKSDLDALTALLQANFSATAVIGSVVQTIAVDLSLLPVIDSKCSNILYNIGSRGDFAYSQTDQLSTIEQINALDLTVIAWLKTLLADLHGL